jgi:hypothetical protein
MKSSGDRVPLRSARSRPSSWHSTKKTAPLACSGSAARGECVRLDAVVLAEYPEAGAICSALSGLLMQYFRGASRGLEEHNEWFTVCEEP